MKILVQATDDELFALVSKLATGMRHDVAPWTPGTPVADDVHLVVIDGLESVIEAGWLSCHTLVLVTVAEMALFPECPFEFGDFVSKPISDGELGARLQRLCTSPPRRDEYRRQILGAAVDASADLFELTTPRAEYEYVNPAFEEVLGISTEELKGKTVASVFRGPQHTTAFYEAMSTTLDAGHTWSGTLIRRSASGRTVHLECSISPVVDGKGETTHHVSVMRDVTERLAREQAMIETNRALEQARDAAVSASRAKSEFLANMSHELRTPLNAIIGYSEMLIEDYEENDQTVKDLHRIRSAGTHLLALINDVLDLSKVEAERIELYAETFSLSELVESVTETVRPLAEKNSNTFETVFLGPTQLHADKTRVQQILLNLLGNACKFTENGHIKLTVSDAQSDEVSFCVEDTGIGMSPKQLDRIFQPFVQADSSTTRTFGGTGLGLVISKRFAEMMHGQIDVESEFGKGSAFTFSMPRGAEVEPRPVEPRIDGPLVLLIDDDPSVHDLFARYLNERGFQVICASTGEAGIRMAADSKPDVVVLDVRMPGMSGWEVLSTLKLSERTAHIPVIMMTIMEQKDVGKALGASDYLVKPIEPERLTQTLRRFVTKPGAALVLVVEDDEPTRELMCRTLTNAGHSTLEAENGQQALDILQTQTPDLILLDLMMPVMDGFTFLDQYQRIESLPRIPTIVATARTLSAVEKEDLLQVTERVIQKGAHTREELLESICKQVSQLVATSNEVVQA